MPEFSCQTFNELNENNENEITLWLVLVSNFSSSWSLWQTKRNFAAAKRLINEFFIVPKKNLFDDNMDTTDVADQCAQNNKISHRSFESTVETLYGNLQDAHAADDCLDRYADDYVQHEHLQVKLKPYQVKTIKWMLDRERVLKHHTNGFVEVKTRAVGSMDQTTKFYYNSKTVVLTTDSSEMKSFALPTGGILAEQMGMGKTIEILDLILLNPRPLERKQLVAPPGSEEAPSRVLNSDMKCLCAQTKPTNTIKCTKCLKHQHRKCVDQIDTEITPDIGYICPACWQNEERIQAKTTLVVSPQSIKAQWKTETDNRIQSGKMSVS